PRRATKLLGLGKGVLEFTDPVDQLVLKRLLAGENAAVRDRVAQIVRRQIALLRHHSQKLIINLHDEALHVIALLRRHWARAIQHVFELSAFEYDRGEADFIEQLLVVQRLNNNADAPR